MNYQLIHSTTGNPKKRAFSVIFRENLRETALYFRYNIILLKTEIGRLISDF